MLLPRVISGRATVHARCLFARASTASLLGRSTLPVATPSERASPSGSVLVLMRASDRRWRESRRSENEFARRVASAEQDPATLVVTPTIHVRRRWICSARTNCERNSWIVAQLRPGRSHPQICELRSSVLRASIPVLASARALEDADDIHDSSRRVVLNTGAS
jgi:hypothetical protein